jgi:outer membrane lipoprotein-sorting protein
MEGIEVDRAQSELGRGADEHLLHIDAERGVILRSEARLEGRPFRIIEMEQISFDERFPDETFTLELPAGATFRSAGEWKRELFGDEP